MALTTVMALIALALLVLGMAGCASDGSAAIPTPAGTANGGAPGARATLRLPTLTAAASPSGNTGQQGVSEFCSKPASVAIQPGSNIPVYSGADLHFSQANGANAFYGFCANATTSAVQDFYTAQLPRSGWSGLQTATISQVIQITATRCAAQNPPKIIVTIAPDTTGTVTTSISIVVLAGAC